MFHTCSYYIKVMVNVAKTSDVTKSIKFFSTRKNWGNKKQNLDISKQRTCSMKLASLNVGKFPQIRSLWMTTNQSISHWQSYSTLSLCFSSKFLVRVSLSYGYVYLGSCISCMTILSLAHLSTAFKTPMNITLDGTFNPNASKNTLNVAFSTFLICQ